MAKLLKKEDVLGYAIGSTALSTGGGGVGASLEAVERMYNEAVAKGAKPELVALSEVPDDAILTANITTGGGVQSEMKIRWGSGGGRLTRDSSYRPDPEALKDRIMENDATFSPLNSWSEIPGPDFRSLALKRLMEIVGVKNISFSIIGEVSPSGSRTLCTASLEGRKVVDATYTGYRAAPEVSQTGLNLANVKCTPAVVATNWGDILVFEKVLCYQRAEDLVEGVALYSGGSAGGPFAISGKEVKKGGIPGVISFVIDIGKAILKAKESGDDIVEAMLDASKGRAYKLFEGKITRFWKDDAFTFIWGESHFKGTGEYTGHRFRAWYKNENHISWLDGKPYVTSPDGINVVDPKTGYGLGNFWPDEWEVGRPVTIIGVRNDERWETPMGLKLFGPQHFFFDIQHVPIDKLVKP